MDCFGGLWLLRCGLIVCLWVWCWCFGFVYVLWVGCLGLSHACLLLLCGSLLRLLFGCCIDVVAAVYAFVFDLFTFGCLVWLSLRC